MKGWAMRRDYREDIGDEKGLPHHPGQCFGKKYVGIPNRKGTEQK